ARRGQRRLPRRRRRLEVLLFRHIHRAARGDREPGLHRLVVDRRRVLAAAWAAALWLAVPEAEADSKAPAQTPEVHLLNRLLDLENATVAAYEAGIPLLDADSAMVAQQF